MAYGDLQKHHMSYRHCRIMAYENLNDTRMGVATIKNDKFGSAHHMAQFLQKLDLYAPGSNRTWSLPFTIDKRRII